MSKPSFQFYLDTANDGSFATEFTSVVIEANWQLGFAEPFVRMARDNTASIIVNNANRNFSPEYDNGAYYGNLTTGRAIKITSTYTSVTRTMWLGFISTISPNSGSKGQRQTNIECTGWMERALRHESLIPIQIAKRADEIIAVILEESDILPPSIIGRWILGSALLGTNTVLGSITDYYAADTGDSTFAFAGDWEPNTSVHSAITQTVEREGGRFFQRRDGTLQFFRRLHFPADVLSLVNLTDKSTEMDYEYGADVANIVSTDYQPRSVGTVGDVVALLTQATLAPANSTLAIDYRFSDSAGTSIGATALITPAANTDYTAFANSDGTGTNLTANLTASITKTAGTAATVTYTNAGAAAFLMPTSQLRGTPLYKYELQVYTATDDASVLEHGKLGFKSAGVQDTITDATTLGDFDLSLYKDAVGRVNSIVFSGWDATLTQTLLQYSIGTRITMHETQTAVNGDWFVVGEQHRLNAGDYRVQWVLEDAGTIIYWGLGNINNSELGQTTILGPL